MKRRLFLVPRLAFVLALLTGIAVPGCAGPGRPAGQRSILHLVLFELNDASHASALIADSRAMTLEIAEIASLRAGTDLEGGRTNLEPGFDVAVAMQFESDAAYRAYLDHPAHRIVVDRWRPYVRSMRVIDVDGE